MLYILWTETKLTTKLCGFFVALYSVLLLWSCWLGKSTTGMFRKKGNDEARLSEAKKTNDRLFAAKSLLGAAFFGLCLSGMLHLSFYMDKKYIRNGIQTAVVILSILIASVVTKALIIAANPSEKEPK